MVKLPKISLYAVNLLPKITEIDLHAVNLLPQIDLHDINLLTQIGLHSIYLIVQTMHVGLQIGRRFVIEEKPGQQGNQHDSNQDGLGQHRTSATQQST